MSYTLELYFKPKVERHRILQYFAEREHYRVAENDAIYVNQDTGVKFWFTLRFSRSLLFRKVIAFAEFEVNFFRPSFFGLEAEIELSAFMAAFRPQIFDPQMNGMDTGSYSGEGFLRGWNFGNRVAIRTIPSEVPDFKITAIPQDTLCAAWAWNYRIPERTVLLEDRQFVPQIRFFRMDGRPCTFAIWSLGMPISLPKVDYVLVGRNAGREKYFGLAPWSEVLEIARRADFDVSHTPLELAYSRTPDPIVKWFQEISQIDLKSLEFLALSQLLDCEAIEDAATLKMVDEQIVGNE